MVTYDIYLTRAIVFKTSSKEILFEKSIVPFSDEIDIYKGDNAISHIEDCNDFLEGWDEGIEPYIYLATFATKVYAETKDIYAIKDALHHSNIDTSKHYISDKEARIDAAA